MPGGAPAARLLIVDDQPANVAMLRALLGQAGYTSVEGVTDPRAALGAFEAFQPDLVLLDLVMPELDGFAVLAQLRPLIPSDGFLPVLVLTADDSAETKRRALAEGATDFLAKPLDPTEVLLRVRNLLRTRALHVQLQVQNAQLEERVRERTRELEEARAQVLALYQELASRNADLQEILDRVVRLQEPARPADAAALARRDGAPEIERLTPREREVLALLAQGRTNAEIAGRLIVSPGTVKFHVEHIIAKLGVADRTQAAVRAVELGLLSGAGR
jgi:putative two-component system response regulator